MDSIASDATEGRLTGSVGYRRAAEYAVSIFREAGLNSGYTNEKGEKSFFQPVPFIRKNYVSTSVTVRKNGKESENNQIASPGFLGYGISEPEMGWDDFAGLDLKGKWVILLDGLPSKNSNLAFPDSLRKKYSDRKTRNSLRTKMLIENKVAGLIILPYEKEIENWEHVVR